jgi:hypothetical protein
MGTGVVDELAKLIDVFLETPPSNRRVGGRAALGVVPWLSHAGLIERLSRMGCCVMVDKRSLREGSQTLRRSRSLHKDGSPFPLEVFGSQSGKLPPDRGLPDFDMLLPKEEDGSPGLIGPDLQPEEVGPVRILGYRPSENSWAPLAHAKMLLLGHIAFYKDVSGYGAYSAFHPVTLWWGSANWTESADRHLEWACASDDPHLMERALSYLLRLVTASEAFESNSPVFKPDLAEGEFDDDAIFEYFNDMPADEEY